MEPSGQVEQFVFMSDVHLVDNEHDRPRAFFDALCQGVHQGLGIGLDLPGAIDHKQNRIGIVCAGPGGGDHSPFQPPFSTFEYSRRIDKNDLA